METVEENSETYFQCNILSQDPAHTPEQEINISQRTWKRRAREINDQSRKNIFQLQGPNTTTYARKWWGRGSKNPHDFLPPIGIPRHPRKDLFSALI